MIYKLFFYFEQYVFLFSIINFTERRMQLDFNPIGQSMCYITTAKS